MEKQIELDKKQKTNQVLSSMLDGFKFTFKLEGLRATLYGQEPAKYQARPVPLLDFELNIIAVLVSI